MKLNKILMALSAMAIVGCSSEDFDDPSVAQAIDDSRLIQLDENFVLAGVGEVGDITRTHWEKDATTKNLVNKFLPIWAAVPTSGDVIYDNDHKNAKLDEQAIGLCWLGQVPDEKVYTNYQFYHFGWLNVDAPKAEFDCGKLTNGALYDEITVTTSGTVNIGDEANEAHFTAYTTASGKTGTPKDDLNFNSGIYKTDNKSIFSGDYIVYYPYNEDFKEAGTIPAKAKTNWATVPTTLSDKVLGKETFRYSDPVDIEGGNQAANFGLNNLSALVQLKVKGNSDSKKIDQIVLWSKKEQLLEQANLAADKIAAGKKGTELYAGTKSTKTIVATFATADQKAVATGTDLNAYITALPTKVEDLVAFVHRADGTWATKNIGKVEFEPNSGKLVTITVAAADFKKEFIAVDEATLITACSEARTVVEGDATAKPVISVIGDITLDGTHATGNVYNFNDDKDANITIKGDAIIVPEDITLTLKTNLESDLRVLGKACCGTATKGGRVEVQGGKLGKVTMEPTAVKEVGNKYDDYNPEVQFTTSAAEIAADKTFDVQAGNVIVDAAVQQHKGNIKIAEGAKLTVNGTAGSLSFLGSTVDNYGTIEVKKAGQFYVKNANGTAVWTDGQNMTNHETGKFIHNVDAVVGTAVQFMNQKGEYRCRVDKQKALDDAYTQWTACNVIEMVAPTPAGDVIYDLAKACKHNDEYIDIEVNNPDKWTSFKELSAPTTSDGKNIQIGNLTVKSLLHVDYKAMPATDETERQQRQLTVNGDMTVSAKTQISESQKVTVTGDLAIDNNAKLIYKGDNKIVEGLKVGGDITVTDATFDASADGAILIECTNFSLIKKNAAGAGAAATFGNRTAGDTNKSMEVKGTISNGKGCKFTISPASGANLLAWITCYKVEGEGTFDGTPTVIKPE